MAKITSESAFEEHIEAVLLKTHGFLPAQQADYDKALCLRPETVISFIRATQTKKWADYCELIGDKAQASRNLLKRIKEVVDKEGTLHALRKGFEIHGGGHFDLCYFEPTNPVAEESRRLYKENLLHLQRQVKFSEKDEKSLDMAMGHNDWDGFAARQAEAKTRGKLLGRGVAHYVESSIGTPVEQTQIHVRGEENRVDLVIGTQPSGQGHETSFAQVAAEWLGLPVEEVTIIVGDTDIVKLGGGSHSGRSMRMAGTVIVKAADILIEKGKRLAEIVLEASASDIEFAEGSFRIKGTDRGIGLYELAREVRGLNDLPEDLAGGLSVIESNEMHTPVFPNGCHICEVEVDEETGVVEIARYASVDDVGRAINPLIVDGQTHGGIVQGAGEALGELCAIDAETGQPLAGSFMDYHMPRADEYPSFRTALNEVPSPTNPLGVKAGGEGGTTPALAVLVNGFVDALRPYGVRDIRMPVTPLKLWQLLEAARAAGKL